MSVMATSYPDLQIDWLRAFVTVVESGSLTRAAPQLYRSQSAVSMQIKKLEEALRQPVLLRGPRHLEVTPVGTELLPYARRLLELHQQTQVALLGPALAGRIRLGVPDDYAATYLTPVLRSFARRYASVEIELTCEQSTSLIPKVANRELDLALVSRDRPSRGKFLFHEPLVWVGAPLIDIWRKNPLPIAVHESKSLARAEALQALDAANRPYRVVYHSSSLAGQVAAVESGLAIAVLTRCSVPQNLQPLQNLPREFALPALGAMEVAVYRSKATAANKAVGALHDLFVSTWSTDGSQE